MTTGQAFIDFSRFCKDRLTGVISNVTVDESGALTTPYFFIQQGPQSFSADRFMGDMFLLGRLVVSKESTRTLADTAAYYVDRVKDLLRADQSDMQEKYDRRTGGSPALSGYYYYSLVSITGDISQVDDKAEHVFTFQVKTLG